MVFFWYTHVKKTTILNLNTNNRYYNCFCQSTYMLYYVLCTHPNTNWLDHVELDDRLGFYSAVWDQNNLKNGNFLAISYKSQYSSIIIPILKLFDVDSLLKTNTRVAATAAVETWNLFSFRTRLKVLGQLGRVTREIDPKCFHRRPNPERARKTHWREIEDRARRHLLRRCDEPVVKRLIIIYVIVWKRSISRTRHRTKSRTFILIWYSRALSLSFGARLLCTTFDFQEAKLIIFSVTEFVPRRGVVEQDPPRGGCFYWPESVIIKTNILVRREGGKKTRSGPYRESRTAKYNVVRSVVLYVTVVGTRVRSNRILAEPPLARVLKRNRRENLI